MRTVDEYLSDTNLINDVLEKLLDMNVEEMSKDKNAGSYINYLIDTTIDSSIVSREDFDFPLTLDMTYLEILALVNSSRGDPKYRLTYCDSDNAVSSEENYLDYVSRLLAYFVKCSGKNRTIEMFGRLKLHDLYKNDTSLDLPKYCSPYERLCSAYSNYIKTHGFENSSNVIVRITDKTSVMEFLKSCFIIAHASWRPAIDDPEKYVEGIRIAYRITGIFLVDFFTRRYRERYDVDKIREKYQLRINIEEDMEELDFCDFDDELPFD